MKKILVFFFFFTNKKHVMFRKDYSLETLQIGTAYFPFGDKTRRGYVMGHDFDESTNELTTRITREDPSEKREIELEFLVPKMLEAGWVQVTN